MDDPIVDRSGSAVTEELLPRLSYRNILLGSQSVNKQKEKELEDDFEILNGDVRAELVNGVTSITFSHKVEKFIEKRMARMIIIKLLGRKNSF